MNELSTLSSKPIGTTAIVKSICTSNATLRHRLLCLGLVEGRTVSVTKRSPLGGTICVELIGFSLALRLSEAEAVSIFV